MASLTPGTTNTVAVSSITGNVAPTTTGAQWEYWDTYTSTVVGTDITPNGWGFSQSGTNLLLVVPAGASQGHGPNRYNLRTAPGVIT